MTSNNTAKIALVTTTIPTDDIDQALERQVYEATRVGALRTISQSSISISLPSPPSPSPRMQSNIESEFSYETGPQMCSSPTSIASNTIISSPPTSPSPPSTNSKHKSCLKQQKEKEKTKYKDDVALEVVVHPLALMTL